MGKGTWGDNPNPHATFFGGGQSKYKTTKADAKFAETRRKIGEIKQQLSDKKKFAEVWDDYSAEAGTDIDELLNADTDQSSAVQCSKHT